MLKRKWIFEIVMVGASLLPARALAEHFEGFTTCEEFERGARFDVYEVIESLWKIFFFWGNNTEMHAISFGLPTQKRVEKFKTEVDVVDQHLGVEWNKAYLFMMPRPGVDVLLLYAGSPGIFRALVKTEDRKRGRPYPPPLLHFADVRMKLVDGLLGMMCCEDLTAYALATIDDMPQTEKKCREAAQFMNYTGHPGRSYLFVQRKIRQRAVEL